MIDDNKDEDEKINDDDDKKESSNSKPKKLKDTSHLHLGNSYAEKTLRVYNYTDESTTCIRCPKCNNYISSKEYGSHRC